MSTPDTAPKQVLFTNMDGEVYRRAADRLRAADIDVHRVSWDDTLLELVESTPFDTLVVGYPVSEEKLLEFLAVARADGAACRRAGLVLVTDPDHRSDAERMIGRGANRIITVSELEEALLPALVELARTAPRLPLRTAARIRLFSDGRPLRVMAQIENISTSGMLLRGVTQFPAGTAFDFEIAVPGESTPLRGSAEITRATDRVHEGIEGVGVRFLSFVGADRLRLERYVATRLG